LKLLVDESLSVTVARLLREADHDAIHVSERNLLGTTDPEVMRVAVNEQRCVITADTDFGELLALGRHPGTSVLLLRRAPHRPQAQAQLLLDCLAEIEADLNLGAVVVVTPGWVRVRRFPSK
jgi:predicted nuclease of predicted toxin-antitoxin system